MELREFAEFHTPALERDEARYNRILGLLARLLNSAQPNPEVRLWTLGASGQCAMQTSPRNPIILGELHEGQCRALADEALGLRYPGVIGSDPIVFYFVQRAAERGVQFHEPIPHQILAQYQRAIYPDVPGTARMVNSGDVDLFGRWLTAFLKEAAPYDPLPTREGVANIAAAGNYRFWLVDDEPVAMAGIVRRTRRGAAIAGVYTPSALRNRGYAAAVTAATVNSVFAEGRTMACLYTDLRNAAANRCYAKIGFKPVCRSAAAFVLSEPRPQN
jgi:ribosomal protein S18 acetylase RimI-like enzyme